MSNQKVIPTAWLIAYCRIFSDIPFSKEIFNEFEKVCAEKGQTIPDSLKNTRLTPQFEARYKLVGRLLKENNVKQILEIASGLSPRGLETTNQDLSLVYVETDFSDLIGEKQQIIINCKKNYSSNLHFEPANAFNLRELQEASKYFDAKKPLAIVNEGLMRYLSFEERTIVAKNVLSLLTKFGGVWITPDVSNRASDSNEILGRKLRDDIIKMTGVNTNNNLFDDILHARKFFEDLCFEVESHNFMEEIDNLTSPKALNLSRQEVEKLLNTRVAFVMRVKK